MKLYIAACTSSDEKMVSRMQNSLERKFGGDKGCLYTFRDRGAWIVASEDTTSSAISDAIQNQTDKTGNDAPPSIPHIVVKADEYYGYHANGLWDKMVAWKESANRGNDTDT